MQRTEAAAGPRAIHTIILVALFSGMVMTTACGKKAAPVSPTQPPIPPVADLSAVAADGSVRLSWTRPAAHRNVVSYEILRAAADRSSPPCPECRPVFEAAAVVRTDGVPAGGSEPLDLTLPLSAGVDYIFKVIPVLKSGARGPDSNSVKVSGL